MKVRDAMHKGVEWCESSIPIVDIARLMADMDIGAVPIGENDRLIGMITDRDITCKAVAKGKDIHKLKAKDLVSGKIIYCHEEDSLEQAIDKMENEQIRRIPVLNSDKRLVGILSMGDISHASNHNKTAEFTASVSAHH